MEVADTFELSLPRLGPEPVGRPVVFSKSKTSI